MAIIFHQSGVASEPLAPAVSRHRLLSGRDIAGRASVRQIERHWAADVHPEDV